MTFFYYCHLICCCCCCYWCCLSSHRIFNEHIQTVRLVIWRSKNSCWFFAFKYSTHLTSCHLSTDPFWNWCLKMTALEFPMKLEENKKWNLILSADLNSCENRIGFRPRDMYPLQPFISTKPSDVKSIWKISFAFFITLSLSLCSLSLSVLSLFSVYNHNPHQFVLTTLKHVLALCSLPYASVLFPFSRLKWPLISLFSVQIS